MATIINTPAPQQDSGGMGLIIGGIILITFLGILVFYGIPALRNMGPVEVNVPAPQVNVEAPVIQTE
jgi:hypothetical protein